MSDICITHFTVNVELLYKFDNQNPILDIFNDVCRYGNVKYLTPQ